MKEYKTALFAGGCFWCMESPYANQEGIKSVIPGYSGGQKKTPHYYDHGDHRESIKIEYDPSKVSYEKLLDIFWMNIDPTDAGGQFADRGQGYLTAIFYQNDEEKKAAEKSKKKLEDSGKFENTIVTEILPATKFYPAEEEHQQFYLKRPVHYQLTKKAPEENNF